MLNNVVLLGRLAQEPEIRYTGTGTPVASFDLAVQVPSKDRNAPPEYLPIVCWDKQAEFVGRHLAKGRQVVVSGHLTTRKWEDKHGQKRKEVEITADRVFFADSKDSAGGGGAYDDSSMG